MAYSYVNYEGDGNTEQFAVPFPYLAQSDVSAWVNGESVTFSWLNDSTITISPAPVAGGLLQIKRETPINERLVDFTDGSILTEADLNTSAEQVFFNVQEYKDTVDRSLTLDNDDKAYNAKGREIRNLGEATRNSSAATLGQVKDHVAEALEVAEERFLNVDGDNMEADLDMSGHAVTGIKSEPEDPTSAIPRSEHDRLSKHVDSLVLNGVQGVAVNAISTEGQTEWKPKDYEFQVASVYLDGVAQRPFEDYIIRENVIIFHEPLSAGVIMLAYVGSEVRPQMQYSGGQCWYVSIDEAQRNENKGYHRLIVGERGDVPYERISEELAEGYPESHSFKDKEGQWWGRFSNNGDWLLVTSQDSISPRSLSVRFADVLNVLDFGAKGNGIDDDTKALQSAFDTGKTVYIPSGLYKLTETLILSKPNQLIYGDSMKTSILQSTASIALKLPSGHNALKHLQVDCQNVEGSVGIQSSETFSENTSGVFEFDHITVTKAHHGFVLGETFNDHNQADTIFRRCIGNTLVGDFIKVQHNQGVNYFLEMCAVNDVNTVLNFKQGGKVTCLQLSVRNANKILNVEAASDNTDYFTFKGISVDGGNKYTQLLTATSGNIYIDSYSSGNVALEPTTPLIDCTKSRARVTLTNSTILHKFSWDGVDGIPLARLEGFDGTQGCDLDITNSDIGSTVQDTNTTYMNLIHRVNGYVKLYLRDIKTRGRYVNTGNDTFIWFTTENLKQTGEDIAYSGGVSPEYNLNCFNLISELSVYTSRQLTGDEKLKVRLQKRSNGILSNVGEYSITANDGIYKHLIELESLNTYLAFDKGDSVRIRVDAEGSGAHNIKYLFNLGLCR